MASQALTESSTCWPSLLKIQASSGNLLPSKETAMFLGSDAGLLNVNVQLATFPAIARKASVKALGVVAE